MIGVFWRRLRHPVGWLALTATSTAGRPADLAVEDEDDDDRSAAARGG